jgi:hypothetical protein
VPFERSAQLTGERHNNLKNLPTCMIPRCCYTTAAGLTLHNTAVCNALDLGDATSPYGSVHPRNKQEVARRFLLAALSIVYRRSTLYRNPMSVTPFPLVFFVTICAWASCGVFP